MKKITRYFVVLCMMLLLASGTVFAGQQGETLAPKAEDVAGFDAFMERYGKGLAMERAAVDSMR